VESRLECARLAQQFEELFVVASRLLAGTRSAPDSQDLRAGVRDGLRRAAQAAARYGYSSEDASGAGFAVVALLDQAFLVSPFASSSQGNRLPLQQELYGGHLAGEVFFTTLE
jgi:type VI secretion system protein ImpK